MSEESAEIKNVRGDVVASLGGSGITGKDIHFRGNFFHIENLTPEATAQLMKLAAMPMEIPSKAAGIEASKTVENREETQKSIDEILRLLKSQEVGGNDAQQVVAGGLQLSRVELLVKQAILLKTEGDQMLMDETKQGKGQPGRAAQGASMTKYREAYALLQEANQRDPINTEVLVHLAQLLTQLTPDDPSDEQRILYRIQNLLSAPKDDVERFRLAQATFMLATSRQPMDVDSLRDARSMFEKLGRAEWVRQCDNLLAAAGSREASSATIPGPDAVKAPPARRQPKSAREVEANEAVANLLRSHRLASATSPAPVPPPPTPEVAPFQPVGRWRVQATDGSVTIFDVYPNGTFQAVQHIADWGMNVQGVGQWSFSPYNQMLQFQGLLNGFAPFAFGIVIQGKQANGYYGVGTDGHGHFLTRA